MYRRSPVASARRFATSMLAGDRSMPVACLAPISSRATLTAPVPQPNSRTVGRRVGASRSRSSIAALTSTRSGNSSTSAQSAACASNWRAIRGSGGRAAIGGLILAIHPVQHMECRDASRPIHQSRPGGCVLAIYRGPVSLSGTRRCASCCGGRDLSRERNPNAPSGERAATYRERAALARIASWRYWAMPGAIFS